MIIKSGTFLIRSNNLQRRAAHSLKAILSILLVNQLQPKDDNLTNLLKHIMFILDQGKRRFLPLIYPYRRQFRQERSK
jgi:hypothetical protein